MAPVEMSQPSNAQYMLIPSQETKSLESSWYNGLFGCTNDCGTFCLSLFCPCIQYGLNAERVYNNDHFFLNCCFYGMLDMFGFGCFLGATNRQNIRQRARITGSYPTDCLVHCCCTPCAMTQEKLQLDAMSQDY